MKTSILFLVSISTFVNGRTFSIEDFFNSVPEEISNIGADSELYEYHDTNWNKEFDKIIQDMKTQDDHHDTLPDSEFHLNPSGKTKVTSIAVTGFSSLYRSSDVKVNNYVGEMKFNIPCGFREVKIAGKYTTSLGAKNSQGTFTLTISNVLFNVEAFCQDTGYVAAGRIDSKGDSGTTMAFSDSKMDEALNTILTHQLKGLSSEAAEKIQEDLEAEIKRVVAKAQEEINKRKTTPRNGF